MQGIKVRVTIDYGLLRKIYFVKNLGVTDKIEWIVNEEGRFIPYVVEKSKCTRFWVNAYDYCVIVYAEGYVKCPLCNRFIKLSAKGLVTFPRPPYDEDEDEIEEQKEILPSRGARTLLLACSSIALRRHLKKDHNLEIKRVKKRRGGHIFEHKGMVSIFYGVSSNLYKCPLCDYVGTLKEVLAHLVHEHKDIS